jgi:tRNA (guanine37-N1)-methyltransferase
VKFHFITLFPELLQNYFSASILGKAVESGKIEIEFLNPRDFSTDKHNRVDLAQVGGGAGMLMRYQPIESAISSIPDVGRVIAFSPVGKPFTQNDAKRLANEKNLILLSGRYEGFDERIIENLSDEVFSIGDFVLTGGELPSLILCDAVSRNVDGVLGNGESLSGESFENELLESPNFTKPVDGVPSEYLKGNHAKIDSIRAEMSKRKTKFFRPDLYNKYLVRK